MRTNYWQIRWKTTFNSKESFRVDYLMAETQEEAEKALYDEYKDITGIVYTHLLGKNIIVG